MSEAAVPRASTRPSAHAAAQAAVRTAAPRRRRLPSAGFVTLCAVYVGVAAFFAWGLAMPPLDRVWMLHHELKAGRIGAPNERAREVLATSMARHPALAAALLREGEIGLISRHSDGWLAMPEATVVRTSKATERFLVLEIATPRNLLPFKVAVKGHGWSKELEITRHGLRGVPLPALRGGAEVIVVKLKGRELRDDPSVLGVRISFSNAAPRGEHEDRT